jgi:hypothetical protein
LLSASSLTREFYGTSFVTIVVIINDGVVVSVLAAAAAAVDSGGTMTARETATYPS